MARTDVQNWFFCALVGRGVLYQHSKSPPLPPTQKRNINIESLSAANAIKRLMRFLGLPNVLVFFLVFFSGASHGNTLQETHRRSNKIKSSTFNKRLHGARLVFLRVSASPRIPNPFAEALFSSFCKSEITVKVYVWFHFFCRLMLLDLVARLRNSFSFRLRKT